MLSERALINASKTLSLGMGVSMVCFRFDFFMFFLSCASGMAMYVWHIMDMIYCTYYKLPAVLETSSPFVHFQIEAIRYLEAAL